MKNNKLNILFGLLALMLIALMLTAYFKEKNVVASSAAITTLHQETIKEPIQPISVPEGLNPYRMALGEKLFNEVRLSANDSISCAFCHDLNAGGMDGLTHSFGINGQEGDVNALTVFNSGLLLAQFWNGRAETLEAQMDGPVHNPKEMGSAWPQVTAKLKADAGYVSSFAKAYPDGITSDNIKDAIATFERSLVTVNAPFDRYLRGEKDAISDDAKAGYQLFKEYGCVACHQGANVGGNMFQKLGIMRDYFADRGNPTKSDLGRFNVTGLEQDRHVFRVPSLRLVSLTAPYFHDGSATNLHDAISVMAKYQLGREIPDQDEAMIIEFLHTLIGEYKGKRLGP